MGIHAKLGETGAALAAFDEAVRLGYNDYIGVLQGDTAPLASHPRFREIYGRMKISPLERAELVWIHSEIKAKTHDLKMMIAENINRKDDAVTEVFVPRVPSHATTPGIEAARETLVVVQQLVRDQVMQADRSRITHLTKMAVIEAIPGDRDPAARQDERLRSLYMARQSSAQRRRAAAQREFVIPGGASTVRRPVPALARQDAFARRASPRRCARTARRRPRAPEVARREAAAHRGRSVVHRRLRPLRLFPGLVLLATPQELVAPHPRSE